MFAACVHGPGGQSLMLGWGWGEMERKFVRFASTCHRTDQPGKSRNISILVQSLGHRFLGETRDSPPCHYKRKRKFPFPPRRSEGKDPLQRAAPPSADTRRAGLEPRLASAHPHFQVCHVCLVHHLIILKKIY